MGLYKSINRWRMNHKLIKCSQIIIILLFKTFQIINLLKDKIKLMIGKPLMSGNSSTTTIIIIIIIIIMLIERSRNNNYFHRYQSSRMMRIKVKWMSIKKIRINGSFKLKNWWMKSKRKVRIRIRSIWCFLMIWMNEHNKWSYLHIKFINNQ